MSSSRLSDQLIRVTRSRINEEKFRNEANLRRATSDLYFATFHAVCEALVEPMGGDPDNAAFKEIYTRVYRQVRHESLEKRCKSIAEGSDFSVDLRRFAKLVVTLKNKREAADYHPLEVFSVSIVKNDLATTETRLRDFWNAASGDRATFACSVGLKVS